MLAEGIMKKDEVLLAPLEEARRLPEATRWRLEDNGYLATAAAGSHSRIPSETREASARLI